MIQNVLIVAGIIGFFDALFNKWRLWEEIELWGAMNEFPLWFFKLTQCQFCLKFHFSIIVTLIMGVISSFGWGLLIVPVISSGLTYLINKK